jgi:hypothetical protein
MPYSYQSSIGVQRQVGTVMAFDADFIYTAARHQTVQQDINLAYNAATGINYPFTDRTKKPYASYGWDQVSMSLTEGKDNYKTVQMSFTKRMASHWQASATYSLSADRGYQIAPLAPGCSQPFTINAGGQFVCDVPITLNPALAAQWYDAGVQRNRFTFNGIWELPYAFQLSGLYIFGDNGWATPTTGQDVLATGGTTGGTSRVRPANSPFISQGALIPWSSFDLSSLSRVDMRLQKRLAVSKRFNFDGMLEVFNVFNRTNYGSWVTNEGNARYGLPTDNNNIAFTPRLVQLGFRTTF